MDEKDRYERLYGELLGYEKKIHEKNQKRIKIGMRCIMIIPLIFLILLFWTKSNKVVFLILWIVSLFLIAVYLILVEYMDYKLQEKLSELGDKERKVQNLIGDELENIDGNLKNAIHKRVQR